MEEAQTTEMAMLKIFCINNTCQITKSFENGQTQKLPKNNNNSEVSYLVIIENKQKKT